MPAIQNKKLETMRHSAEHVLTQAMLKLYPGLKMAMGPATEDGFYFDFDFKGKISEDNFPKIEEEMKKIIKKDLPFKKENLTIEEARKLFKNNKYKQEWLDEIENKGEKATVYWTGDEFVDLCSGSHVASTGKIGPFKLLSVAGAYWRGDEKNKMLTRIYGTTFPTRKELDEHLKKLEEAKKRDHRVLGQKLELFMFDDEVGQGLPLWLPKGAFVRHKIMEFAFNTYLERGYQPVVGPHISTEALWKHSGHLDFYKELMYSSFGIDDEQYRLKPMNCPIHVKMYNLRPRSYKELPLRWTEMGTVYRYEKSGVLHGLTRVRGFTQDDAHIICRPDQLHDELVEALKLTLYILGSFGFEDFEMSLSVRDKKNKDKYAGDDEGWEMAENIQFDFNLPGSFKMKYIGKDGKEHEPFMIHRALLGSLERFMGIYIEHTAGEFPVWLAPVQAKILPVTERNIKYAKSVAEKLKQESIRVEVDERNETLPAKIRDAQLEKVPYMLIVGDKEEKSKKVAVRLRTEKDLGQMSFSNFIVKVKDKIETKALDLI
jgi:threonyl-tRNA synthetase